MKIVHICAATGVYDGWNYQENMLSKYHKRMGNEVTIITSQIVRKKNGAVSLCTDSDYFNPDGVKMIRLRLAGKNKPKKFRRLKNFRKKLNEEKPDIIFIHNCQFLNIGDIINYAKNNKVKIYVDSHIDYSNSASNFLSKEILHKKIWRHQVQRLLPYVSKFYGVLPARVDFLIDVYHTPKDKTKLLVMGGDDEMIDNTLQINGRDLIRTKYNIISDDFLIVTGGKIDSYKWQTLNLIKAIKQINNEKIKLLIFGSVSDDIKQEFDELCNDSRIIYIGWINSDESYKYFSASDLVVFPGRHSVFWEQVAAQQKPMICRYWDGTTHVDGGGNVVFLKTDTVEEIVNAIKNICEDDNQYSRMKAIAEKNSIRFKYSDIAKESIEWGLPK